jgi:threonine dehydrogenase-like Zn-dependent dehydrogenase
MRQSASVLQPSKRRVLMKALVWEAPRKMVMRNLEKPTAARGEVVLRVIFAGICGSELSGYLGHNALRVPPLVMGHEFSGEIVSLGDGVLEIKPGLALGQQVTVNPLASCGGCYHCVRGLNHLCASRKLLGAHLPGAYAEFIKVPAELVHVLPEGMTARTGALTEPVAVAVRIGELAGEVTGEDALILGAGPIGLLALQVFKARGAKQVFIADLDAERLAMGGALGGQTLAPRELNVVQTVREATLGLGVAVSLDAVGTAVTRAQCISATRSAATMILSGLHEEVSSMPAAEIIRREIVLKGSFAYSPANFVEALEMLARDEIRLDPWIVEAALEEGGQWFDRLIDAPGNVSKVLLQP